MGSTNAASDVRTPVGAVPRRLVVAVSTGGVAVCGGETAASSDCCGTAAGTGAAAVGAGVAFFVGAAFLAVAVVLAGAFFLAGAFGGGDFVTGGLVSAVVVGRGAAGFA